MKDTPAGLLVPSYLAEQPIGEPETPPDPSWIKQRYKITAGRLLVARERASDSWSEDVRIEMTDDRKRLVQMFTPWATVLMVGDPVQTDFGTTLYPPPVKEGQRIFINAASGTDVELGDGETKMTVTLIGFGAVMLIDQGSEA